ncbi:MAG: hypothetical protein JSR58_01835 [Verrucomicrobia bacterium]|nr:hypothetical protein [Verrucomicrobiota bacterium]
MIQSIELRSTGNTTQQAAPTCSPISSLIERIKNLFQKKPKLDCISADFAKTYSEGYIPKCLPAPEPENKINISAFFSWIASIFSRKPTPPEVEKPKQIIRWETERVDYKVTNEQGRTNWYWFITQKPIYAGEV